MTVALAPLQPVLTQMSVSDDMGAVSRVYVRGGRYALWLSMAIAGPMLIYSDAIMTLYLGAGHGDAALVNVLMVAAFPAYFAHVMISRVAIATGNLRMVYLGALGAASLMVIAAYLAAAVLDAGAVGVAAAVSGTTIVTSIGYFWPLGLRESETPARVFALETLLLGLLPAAGGLAVWSLVRTLHEVSSWAGLVLHVGAGWIAYGAVLLAMCLDEDERLALRRTLRRGLGRVAPSAAESVG